MSDYAFGPMVLGIVFAVAAVVICLRSAEQSDNQGATPAIVLTALVSVLAVMGAVLVLSEPGVFNAGYGCLGRSHVWLAVAMKPTPAPCGYRIPSADEALFYPAAVAAAVAAIFGVACGILMRVGRIRPPT